MNTRRIASLTAVVSFGATTTPVPRAKSRCPVIPPSARR